MDGLKYSRRGVPLVPLIEWQGLHLGVTACRAQTRYGYLSSQALMPAPLTDAEKLGWEDELLDLVLINPDAPDGFEFSGLSLAEFWGGMQRLGLDSGVLSHLNAQLMSLGVLTLRGMLLGLSSDDRSHYLAHVLTHRCTDPAMQYMVALNKHLATVGRALPGNQVSGFRSLWQIDVVAEHYAPWLVDLSPGSWRGWSGIRGQARHTTRWHHVRLQPCAEDVRSAELQVTLPNLETSYHSAHFPARNLLAHIRYSGFEVDGRRVLLIEEIQSDWVADLRRQQRGEFLYACPEGGWHGFDNVPDVPPCPFAKVWLQESLRALLGIARLRGYERIAWLPPALLCLTQHQMPLGLARELYGRQLPRQLQRMLGERVGSVGYEVWFNPLNVEFDPVNRSWMLIHPSGRKDRTGYASRAAALEAHQRYATRATLQLPCIDLEPACVEDFACGEERTPAAV